MVPEYQICRAWLAICLGLPLTWLCCSADACSGVAESSLDAGMHAYRT